MSEHASAWTFAMLVAVVGVIGLYHAGINIGGELNGAVRSLMHLFGAPI